MVIQARPGTARADMALEKRLCAAAIDRPWQGLDEAELGPARSVPSMLSKEELRFYFWLSRQMSDASGAVVDLGSFIGGSTAYLAQGTRAGGAEDKQIFAFDHFAATEKVKEKQLYPKGIERFEGDEFLHLSKQLLAPWAPNIQFRQGRIEECSWTHGPISLLVLDASKTAAITDHIAKTFFPYLVPGRSVILQQDELHWKEPWIAAQMQRLSRHFVPICHIPGSTVAYVYVKRIGSLALRWSRVAHLSDDMLLADLAASKERLAVFNVDPQIDRQVEAVRLNPGMRKSWRFKNRPSRQVARETSS